MSQLYTPPSTIDGISRLAKSIRKECGIKHTSALDIAATRAGFQNFKNAKRELSSQGPSTDLQPLYLTVYWRDRDARQVIGRCTAEVRLPPDTLNRLESLKDRGYWMLGGFELESLDHLQARLDDSSLDQAKKRIADAVRELQFCVATGLRRMRKVVDKNRVTFLQHLPGKDHMSIWVEESTGNWLALDEPYHSPYIDNLYYGKERAKYQGIDELRQGIREARTLILAGYNECRPRHDILKVLDAVEKNAIAQAINA